MWLLWVGVFVQISLMGLLLEPSPPTVSKGYASKTSPAERLVFVYVEDMDAWPPLYGPLARAAVAQTDSHGPLPFLTGIPDDPLKDNYNSFFNKTKKMQSVFDQATQSYYAGPLSIASKFRGGNTSLPFTKLYSDISPTSWNVCSELANFARASMTGLKGVIFYAHIDSYDEEPSAIVRNLNWMVFDIEDAFNYDGRTSWILVNDGGQILIWGPGIKIPKCVKEDRLNHLLYDISTKSQVGEIVKKIPEANITHQPKTNGSKELPSMNRKKRNVTLNSTAGNKINQTNDKMHSMNKTSEQILMINSVTLDDISSSWGFPDPRKINQTDLAALIVALIGIDPPMASSGHLPEQLLDMPPKELAQLILSNAKHLASRARKAASHMPSCWISHYMTYINDAALNMSAEFSSDDEVIDTLESARKMANAALNVLIINDFFFCFLHGTLYSIIALGWVIILISEILPVQPTRPPYIWGSITNHQKVQGMVDSVHNLVDSVRRATLERVHMVRRGGPKSEDQGDGMTDIPLGLEERSPSPVPRERQWKSTLALSVDIFAALCIAAAVSAVLTWSWHVCHLYYIMTAILVFWAAIRSIIIVKISFAISGVTLVVAAAAAISIALQFAPGVVLNGGNVPMDMGVSGAVGIVLLVLLSYGSTGLTGPQVVAFAAAVLLTIIVPVPPPAEENPWMVYPTVITIIALIVLSLAVSSNTKGELIGLVSLVTLLSVTFLTIALADIVGGVMVLGASTAILALSQPLVEAVALRRLVEGRPFRAAVAFSIPILLLSSWTEPLIYTTAAALLICWAYSEVTLQSEKHLLRGLIVCTAMVLVYISLSGHVVHRRMMIIKVRDSVLSFSRQMCAMTGMACVALGLTPRLIPAVLIPPALVASLFPLPIPPYIISSCTKLALSIFQIVVILAFAIAKYLFLMQWARF